MINAMLVCKLEKLFGLICTSLLGTKFARTNRAFKKKKI